MKHNVEFIKTHGESECPDDCYLNTHLGYTDDEYERLTNALTLEMFSFAQDRGDNRMLWQMLRDVLDKVDLPSDPTPAQCIAIGLAYAKAMEIDDICRGAIREAAMKRRKAHGRGGLIEALMG